MITQFSVTHVFDTVKNLLPNWPVRSVSFNGEVIHVHAGFGEAGIANAKTIIGSSALRASALEVPRRGTKEQRAEWAAAGATHQTFVIIENPHPES